MWIMKNFVSIVIGLSIFTIVTSGYFIQSHYQKKYVEVLRNENEIRKMADRALKLAEEAHERATEEHTKKLANEADKLAKKKLRKKLMIARTVKCPECANRFVPHDNKAPLLGAFWSGAGTGATIGGAGGAYLGAGTGVAMGGVGAVPGTVAGGAIGAIGGGVTGGMGAAWHRDRQLKCPYCDEVFANPKY
jgi:hypothetical protein